MPRSQVVKDVMGVLCGLYKEGLTRVEEGI